MNYWCQVLSWYQEGGHAQILSEWADLEQAYGSGRARWVDFRASEAASSPHPLYELDGEHGKSNIKELANESSVLKWNLSQRESGVLC